MKFGSHKIQVPLFATKRRKRGAQKILWAINCINNKYAIDCKEHFRTAEISGGYKLH